MAFKVRIDDVLNTSTAWTGSRSPEKRFRQISRWLAQSDKIIHVPTILCTDIEQYPAIIELIREETAAGRMKPAIHGWEHVDYNALSREEVHDHLRRSMAWFLENLDYTPTVWATPWGADSEKLRGIAAFYGLELEGVDKVITPGRFIELSKRYEDVNDMPEVTTFWHWWNRGINLLRVVEIIKYGNYQKAAEVRNDLF